MCDVDGERTLDELAADPAVARALTWLGQRLPHDPCPRCGQASIAPQSKHGFCQPCSTAQEERIRASKRRSYHRHKTGDDAAVAGSGEGDPADAEPGEPTRDELDGIEVKYYPS